MQNTLLLQIAMDLISGMTDLLTQILASQQPDVKAHRGINMLPLRLTGETRLKAPN
jgi:hypothetical protein